MKDTKELDSFIDYAKLAATAERARQFNLAEDLWNKAALHSTNVYNIEWAYNRMFFCSKQKN